VAEPLLQQPAVGKAGQPGVGGEVEELPRAFVEHGQALQQRHDLVAVEVPAGPEQPPGRLGLRRPGRDRQRHHRHARCRRLQAHERVQAPDVGETDGEEDDAGAFGGQPLQRWLERVRRAQLRIRQAGVAQEVAHQPHELPLGADHERREALTRAPPRRVLDLGPSRGRQIHRRAGFRLAVAG
jgi:hypothetical protein